MKLVVSEFLSLDGVMEGPGPDDPYEHAGWTMPYSDEEIMKFKLDELMASEALLLGRNTYEGFANAWPSRKDDAGFASKMNSMPKYVICNTNIKTDWDNSHVISKDVITEIKKLKAKDGQDLLLNGSGKLLQTLISNNLVDEYRLLVYPIVLGSGKRLFCEGTSTNLHLVSTESYKTGVVLLKYKPDLASV